MEKETALDSTEKTITTKKDELDDLLEDMGPTQVFTRSKFQELEDQIHRQSNVYFNEQKQRKVIRSRVNGTVAMRHDKAELGSKTWWKPSEEEKRKNAKIDETKNTLKLKKATAYSLDLYKVLLKKKEDGAMEPFTNGDDMETLQRTVQKLQSVSLTSKMFGGAYIYTHFSELYDLIRDYDRFRAAPVDIQKSFGDFAENIVPRMELLKKRVKQFAAENRMRLSEVNGSFVMSDKESLTKNERITDADIRQWMILTSQGKKTRKEERKRKDLEEPQDLTAEQMKEKLAEAGTELNDEQVNALKTQTVDETVDFYQMTREERIENLPAMATEIRIMATHLSDSKPDTEDALLLRKMIAELDTLRRLTEAEIRYHTAEGSEKEALGKQVLEYAEEVRRIKKRKQREGLPSLVPEGTLPKKYQPMTRTEATDNPSDDASYEARVKLLQTFEQWFDKVNRTTMTDAEGKKAAQKGMKLFLAYFEGNQYAVGHKEEEKRLKALQKWLNGKLPESLKQSGELDVLKQELSKLTDGGLEIPEGLVFKRADQVDENTPAETTGPVAVALDFSKEFPVDEGNFKTSVNIRDGAMQNFFMRTKENRKDDPLFAHEPTINDLRQGKVSNCWMVAGTTALIDLDPSIIKNCMKDNGDGTVTVRLYNTKMDLEAGKPVVCPVYVKVKKEVPRLDTGGVILTDGPLWMSILERALAHIGREHKRGYRSLWHGRGGDWIAMLTGKQPQKVASQAGLERPDLVLNEKQPGTTNLENPAVLDSLFWDIANAKKNQVIYSYGSVEKASAGMNAGHAYTVLGAEEVDGVRYVIMRNPYANMTLKYDEKGKESMEGNFMDSDVNESCGQFRIKFEDFIKNMEALHRTDMKQTVSYQTAIPKPASVIHRPR